MASYLDLNGLRYFVKKLREQYYPVGTIYISTTERSPANTIGGTWERYAQGRALFGVGSEKAFWAGTTGGEAEHTLTIDEMPKHSHKVFTPNGYATVYPDSGHAVIDPKNFGGNSSETGGGKPHNNLPPYVAVYIWRRIS